MYINFLINNETKLVEMLKWMENAMHFKTNSLRINAPFCFKNNWQFPNIFKTANWIIEYLELFLFILILIIYRLIIFSFLSTFSADAIRKMFQVELLYNRLYLISKKKTGMVECSELLTWLISNHFRLYFMTPSSLLWQTEEICL